MKIFRSRIIENVFLEEYEVQAGNCDSEQENCIVNVFDDVEYQKIMGFGAAITESAAYNYSLLSDEQKREFLEKYYGEENGLNYSVGRLHINSCDFSLDIYDYVQPGDKTLDTFNIDRDRKYIIPMVKDIQNYCNHDLFFFASPWTPPAYMKDNESHIKGGKLKEEYKKLWAKYFAKYIKEYRKEGINISAVTVQNEPKAVQTWESCCYSPEDEKEFVEKYLVPTFDEEGLSDIKIIIWDHNKERVYDRAKKILAGSPAADRVWAVGYHWYSGDHFEGLRLVHERFNKVLINTEFCCSFSADINDAAENYAKEICEDLNNYTAAICDWNILLNQHGGPYHNRINTANSEFSKEDKGEGCYAPVLYDFDNKKLIYTPIYYYIAHFAMFIKPGAVRIATTKYTDKLYTCAFKNEDGGIVLVVLNITGNRLPVNIRMNDCVTEIFMEPHSIQTILL